MNNPMDDNPQAALAARRAIQAILDADHRDARLQAARRHEDELIAGADQFVLTIGGFLRRLRKTGSPETRPPPLHRAESHTPEAESRRDAA